MAFQPFRNFGQPFARAFGRGGGGAPSPYLLRDDFTTDKVAPLGTPLVAEPGPGQWVILDTGNKLSKSSGNFVYGGMQVSSTSNPDPRANVSFPRKAGRAFVVKFAYTAERVMLGWYNTLAADLNDISVSFQILSSAFQTMNITGNTSINIGAAAISTNYQVTFVLFDTGGAFFITGGAFGAWFLLWLVTEGTAATVYATLVAFSAGVAYTVDTARVVDLPSTFQSASNLSTFTTLTPALGANGLGTADALDEFEFILDGAPLSLDEGAILRFHWTDDNNCWKAYIKRNVGNTAWDLLVDSVLLGVPTNRLTVTGVGTPSLLRIKHVGSLIDCYTRAAGVYTKRGAQINVSFQNTTTGVEVSATAGTTRTRLASYAYTRADYATTFDPYFL